MKRGKCDLIPEPVKEISREGPSNQGMKIVETKVCQLPHASPSETNSQTINREDEPLLTPFFGKKIIIN